MVKTKGSSPRLALAQVTLCAVSSVNVAATMHALAFTLNHIDVACCKFFTDQTVTVDHPGIEIISIDPITSSQAYSHFVLTRLVDHIETSHCLIVQWDGHVLNASRWQPGFLDYDYIGARWPQFDDGHDVGNGGFSLRSRRLMEVCRDPSFRSHHPEDVAIGRSNRSWLESRGMRFAPSALADCFSVERAGDITRSFGYHGVWSIIRAIGTEAFWNLYQDMDDRTTIRHDLFYILKKIIQGPKGIRRAIRLITDNYICKNS